MNKELNCRIVLASRPNGEPTLDNFKLVENPIPELGKDEMLLHTVYLSLDPYMRDRMSHLSPVNPYYSFYDTSLVTTESHTQHLEVNANY